MSTTTQYERSQSVPTELNVPAKYECTRRCFVGVCLIGWLPILVWSIFVYFQLQNRSYELERQDKSPNEGAYTQEQFFDMMKLLATSNAYDKHGYNASLRHFDKVDESSKIGSILEIGVGLGLQARWAGVWGGAGHGRSSAPARIPGCACSLRRPARVPPGSRVSST